MSLTSTYGSCKMTIKLKAGTENTNEQFHTEFIRVPVWLNILTTYSKNQIVRTF